MLLELADPEDEIVVFYTKNSPHMSYASVIRLLNAKRPIKFEECHEGSNGLDFQLISYLGYLMKNNDLSDSEFIVMSNDTGFDPAVRFWKDRNFPVNRINVNYCKLQLQQRKDPSDSDLKEIVSNDAANQPPIVPVDSDSPQSVQKPYNFNKEEVDTFLNCIGKSNLTAIHETLVHVYGQKQGQNIYKTVKDKAYPLVEESYQRREKVMHFSDIIFRNSDVSNPGNFVDFLEQYKEKTKNLNSIRAAIVKSYGNENGTKYYSLFKPYFKIISALK